MMESDKATESTLDLREKVPAIYVQITGVKAELRQNPGVKKTRDTLADKDVTVQWLSVQNDWFVALP